MNVIKRNGRKEPIDFTKITKNTKPATEGLPGTSYTELERDAKISLNRPDIKTTDIQQTLIKTAVDKIDIDRPNWTFVAARLKLYDLYHSISKKGYTNLDDYFNRMEKTGRYQTTLRNKYDLKELSEYMRPERDLQFTYLGLTTLIDRYLIKDNNGNVAELPQELFMGVAMFLAQNETDRMYWAKKFYDVLSKFEVMTATPTLSNARTKHSQCSSCYIGSTPDSIEGIFNSYHEQALLSKYGGGIGWDWGFIRSMLSSIDGFKGVSGGVTPFLKLENDIAIAVDQLGTRKGAIAVYVEPWTIDIRDFLDLKKNSGEERRRAHDLFPAIWLNDLFMERVQNDEPWTLFDPYEVKILHSVYGENFKRLYESFENNDNVRKEVVSAKGLWKEILRSYFETGSPFLTFKDEANRRNQNSHYGVIYSSNLCTEIFQNTKPDSEKYKLFYNDGTEEVVDPLLTIETADGEIKNVKDLSHVEFLELGITGYEKVPEDGETAVCNLASVNLSKVNTKEDFERVIPIAIRMLDNVIDLNFYPKNKIRKTNIRNRAIGLGIMGEAQMLAEKGITFGTKEHFEFIDSVMEHFSYNVIKSSCDLSYEKGPYPAFSGSNWSKGILPIDTANEKAKQLTNREYDLDWEQLRERVKNGIRNGYLMAIAPTSSISILTGTTQAIEPVYKRKWFEENLSGLIPVTAPNISPDTWNQYVSAYEVKQSSIIKAGAIRQKWIDQGQSLNIFVRPEETSGKTLNDLYMKAWSLGLKSTYYLRSQSPEATNDVEDRSQECFGCQ